MLRCFFRCLLLTLLLAACATPRREEPPTSFREMKRDFLKYDPNLDDFAEDGPFDFVTRENVPYRLGDAEDEVLVTDVFLAKGDSKAPLVIIAHGNHSRKEAHRYQAEHIASYGMHAMTVQLTNRAQWMRNGRLLAALVRKIAKNPKIVSARVDKKAIILVGHSFGGSAITVAAGMGAPVKGLVLLDPAVVAPDVKPYMKRVDEPAVLLGADKNVFRARKQPLFYKHMAGEFGEISVRGATHDDAQSPSMFSLSAFGFDPYTSRDKQRTFSTALVASAFSIGATGSIKWAWQAFRPETRNGTLTQARRKAKVARAE